jgi:hypothetical protein
MSGDQELLHGVTKGPATRLHRFPLTTPLAFDLYLYPEEAFITSIRNGANAAAFDVISGRIDALTAAGPTPANTRRLKVLFDFLLREPDALWLCRRTASRLRLPVAHLARQLRYRHRRRAARLIVTETQRFCEHAYADRLKQAARSLGRLVGFLRNMRRQGWPEMSTPALKTIPNLEDLLHFLHRLLSPAESAAARRGIVN